AQGVIDLQVNGGVGPYRYIWNTGATTASINNLSAGNYSVTVTDHNNCTITHSATITEPSLLTMTHDVSHVSCFEFSDGKIELTIAGGVQPYTYIWNTGATTKNIHGVVAGNYSVTMRDANACQIIRSFVITQPTALQLASTHQDVSC